MQPDPYRTGPRVAAAACTIGAVVALWIAIHQPSPGTEPASSAWLPGASAVSSSSGPAGSDVGRSLDPAGEEQVVLVAVRFTAGWLEPDPARRQQLLADTAAPGLAAQLGVTAGYKVPRLTVAADPVRLLAVSETSADVVVGFSDASGLRLGVVLAPGTRYGWQVATMSRIPAGSR